MTAVARVIERRMQVLGIDQAELARRSGVSATYLSEIMRGASKRLGLPVAVQLAEVLEIDPRFLDERWATRLGENKQPSSGPIVGRIGEQAYTATVTPYVSGAVGWQKVPKVQQRVYAGGTVPADAETAIVPLGKPGNYLAIEVSGHCMEPTIPEGYTVVVDCDLLPQDRDICVVLLHGECTLKRMLRLPDGDVWLVPDNKDAQYEPIRVDDPEARVIGTVVLYGRWSRP